MNADKLRPGQRRALDVILSRARAGESKTSIIIPTRYGKSDLIRLSSFLAKRDGIISGSIALSPNRYLRNQVVREDEVGAMAARYGLDNASAVRPLESLGEIRPFGNDEYLLSATIQLMTRDINGCVDLVESRMNETGKPVLIHIDECHETAEKKVRGELVSALDSIGALFSLYTATAVRADGDVIPGFRFKTLDSWDVRRWVTKDKGDGIDNQVDVYDGERRLVELQADHWTSFQQAWNETPSPLCKMSREVVDVNLKDLSAEEEAIPLSECPPGQARRYLGKAVWHPVVVELAVELFVNELRLRRKVNPYIAGIIFTSNDFDGEDNRHAKLIVKELKKQAPEFSTCIVTMKTEEGDAKSSSQIERFVGVNGKKGEGNILLLKQMGGSGLNIPRGKVLLDLSPIRTVANVVQRLTRVATPFEQMNTCSIVTLADPLMGAIWSKYVVEEGGAVDKFEVDAELTKIDSYLKKKSGSEDDRLMSIISAEVSKFDNHWGQSGDLEYRALVDDLFARVPVISNVCTKAELSASLKGFVLPTNKVSNSESQKSLKVQIAKKRVQIFRRTKDMAQDECPYSKEKPKPHVERIRYWTTKAKQYANVNPKVELSDITELSTLDTMLEFLKRSVTSPQ